MILTKGWRCLDCTLCEGCGKGSDEARLLLCDSCDISYHTYCLDPPLGHVPQGGWKCKWWVWTKIIRQEIFYINSMCRSVYCYLIDVCWFFIMRVLHGRFSETWNILVSFSCNNICRKLWQITGKSGRNFVVLWSVDLFTLTSCQLVFIYIHKVDK